MSKLIIFITLLVFSFSYAKDTLIFGICPHDSGPTKVKRWYVLADYLSKKLGKKVIVSEDFTFDAFIKKFSNGEYDFVYINPMHYVVAHNLQGYMVFAKEKGRKDQGVIIVRKDSSINHVSQLKGKKLVFPSPTAWSATILVAAYLNDNGLVYGKDYSAIYTNGPHEVTALAIIKRFADAGGSLERFVKNARPFIRSNIKILAKTQRTSPHVFAYSPKLDAQTKTDLQQALFSLNREGRDVLLTIGFKGIEVYSDEDMNDVREIMRKLGLPFDKVKGLD